MRGEVQSRIERAVTAAFGRRFGKKCRGPRLMIHGMKAFALAGIFAAMLGGATTGGAAAGP